MSPATASAPSSTAAKSGELETMTDATRAALRAYLFAIADDEMLTGHRLSEWTGLGPIMEEDIAFSSMAQDEMGHALVWYQLLGRLGEADPDRLAFLRDAPDWRHARLCELPRGDYAFSLVRQYLYDLAEALRYEALTGSSWAPLAESAVKLRQEEKYHLLHGKAYVERLGRSEGEAHERLQAALDELYPYALGLWESPEGEGALVEAGIVTESSALRERWIELCRQRFGDAGLTLPAGAEAVDGGRKGRHGEHLEPLLAAMQGLFRSDPDAVW